MCNISIIFYIILKIHITGEMSLFDKSSCILKMKILVLPSDFNEWPSSRNTGLERFQEISKWREWGETQGNVSSRFSNSAVYQNPLESKCGSLKKRSWPSPGLPNSPSDSDIHRSWRIIGPRTGNNSEGETENYEQPQSSNWEHSCLSWPDEHRLNMSLYWALPESMSLSKVQQ